MSDRLDFNGEPRQPIRTATVSLSRALNGQQIGREVTVRARTDEQARLLALAEANSRLVPGDGLPHIVVAVRWLD